VNIQRKTLKHSQEAWRTIAQDRLQEEDFKITRKSDYLEEEYKEKSGGFTEGFIQKCVIMCVQF